MQSIDFTNQIHKHLSHAQAIPVAGVLVSPIKGLLALVEAIVGFASMIFFGTLSYLSASTKITDLAGVSVIHFLHGSGHFAYACGNFFTLGYLAHKIEKEQFSFF